MKERTAPRLTEVEHIDVFYDRGRYAGHPRQGGIFNFGGGEIAVIHNNAPCAYARPEDVKHDWGGYHARAVILLQRSTDGGQTWPAANNVVLYDEAAPLEERRAFLERASLPAAERPAIDLGQPHAAIYFGRTYAGPPTADGRPGLVCYALRSSDKGATWEPVPTLIPPPPGREAVHKDAHPLVACPDGTYLAAMTVGPPGAVVLYGSDDQGLTWEYLAEIVRDPTGFGRPTYAGLLLLPGGRLQCYTLNIGGLRNAIQLCHSDDGGYSWSAPRPIVAWGGSPWAARRPAAQAAAGVHYRSPWPLRLRDGRIVVLFGRRKPPFGLGLIVSEDEGATWSGEAVIRDDSAGPDLGYPVATQLEDGRIFTAYYFTRDDGNRFGGTRYIAGSFFRIG